MERKNNDLVLNSGFNPLVFEDNWIIYSNLNFDKPYTEKSEIELLISVPSSHNVYSELKLVNREKTKRINQYYFEGNNVKYHDLIVTKNKLDQFNIGQIKFIQT